MLASALLFIWNLAGGHAGAPEPDRHLHYAVAVHPPRRLPAALNGFGLWNALVAVLMLVAYGYPVAQFFWIEAPPAMVHRIGSGG